jgi:hypothetical protein
VAGRRGSSADHGWCAAAVWLATSRRVRRLKTTVKEEDFLVSRGRRCSRVCDVLSGTTMLAYRRPPEILVALARLGGYLAVTRLG